jgi:hypothetical protein
MAQLRRVHRDPVLEELAMRWERFWEQCERDRVIHEAYAVATKLDGEGKSGEADQVLRTAGVASDVVEWRRRSVGVDGPKK